MNCVIILVKKVNKVSVGLINPKSPDNVSSVMRSAGNFQVDNIFYTGTRYSRAIKFKKRLANVSRKVGENIPLNETVNLLDEVSGMMKIVCIELVENSISLPEFQHPEHAFYIFGPEDGSIGQDIIDKADAVVYVPTVGCMNLSATVNVVLYDRLAKSSQRQEGNELIRQSRDVNNRLQVNL